MGKRDKHPKKTRKKHDKQHLPSKVKKSWWHSFQKLRKDLEYGGVRGKRD